MYQMPYMYAYYVIHIKRDTDTCTCMCVHVQHVCLFLSSAPTDVSPNSNPGVSCGGHDLE